MERIRKPKFIFSLCPVIVLLFFPVVEGSFGLHCWRDSPNTKLNIGEAISEIRRHLDSPHGLVPGQILRVVYEAVWPFEFQRNNMYCFDEEIHGSVSVNTRKKYSDLLEGFRPAIDQILNSTRVNPRDAKLEKSLHNLHVNVSLYFKDFLQVFEIERSSLYLREYSLLLLGIHAEIVNFYRATGKLGKAVEWLEFVAGDCYALSKFSYWFIRFMSKKMSDNIILDAQKFSSNKLGFINKVNGKRLSQFEETLSKCGANDNINCYDYALSYLKAVRITTRHDLESFWKDLLHDIRRQLYQHYCATDACLNDRYPEFYVRVGEPIALQFHASNAESGKFCSKDYCSTMWLSSGAFNDYIYYRSCPGDNALEAISQSCPSETWRLCSDAGECSGTTFLTNNYFPVSLRSVGNQMCVDCSETTTWCKQSGCLEYARDRVNNGSARRVCPSDRPQDCIGPQFQIHNFERGFNMPLEVLDEVHFTYASARDGPQRFLSGDIFSGAFFRTQFYMRLEMIYTVSSTKTGITSTLGTCPTNKPWSRISDDEQIACAQSSYTLFKRVIPESVLSTKRDDQRNDRFEQENLLDIDADLTKKR